MPRFFNNVSALSTTDCTGANTGSLQAAGGAYVAEQLQVGGVVSCLATTASTSTTNGSLVVAGGVGIAGAVNVGSTVTATEFIGSGAGLTAGTIPISAINATGTPSGSTFLCGNGTWAAASGGMTNPMSSVGQIIIGGTAGAPTALSPTTNNYVLTLVSGSPAWAAASGGMSNPFTTAGDLAVCTATGTPGTAGRLGIGSTGQVLAVVTGAPAWTSSLAPITLTTASSTAFLTTTRSDLTSSVTFTQTAASTVTCSGIFAATQFNGSGAGLSLGTVTDTYTIQSLGTLSSPTSINTASGRYVRLTLGGNLQLTLPNGNSSSATEKVIFEITQDGTGSRTIYWLAQKGFIAGATPVLSTAAGAIDILEFTWNGSYWMNTGGINNISPNTSLLFGYRPSTYNTTFLTSSWATVTNPTYAYDTGTTPSVDASTYGYFSTGTPGINCGPTTTFSGFSGSTKSGTLYVSVSITNPASNGHYAVVNYSTNGGSTWTALETVNSGSSYSGTLSVALTSQVAANLQVQITGYVPSGYGPITFTVYDIVFI